MSYSFKDEVINRIPKGHRFVDMTSVSETETVVETVKDAIRHTLSMDKVNLSDYFFKLPTISLSSSGTYNDLYAKISDYYGLGLINGVDYYDSKAVKPTQEARYVELPINHNSHAYYGLIRCYVTTDVFGGISSDVVRDLSLTSHDHLLMSIKIRHYLMGSVFSLTSDMFIGDKLSAEFINHIVSDMYGNIDIEYVNEYQDKLTQAVVVDCFNDGLSDLVLIKIPNDLNPIFIRFSSQLDDLPIIKNNESIDLETRTLKEVLVGEDDSVSEDPGEGKGDLLYTAERSDSPNPVSSLKTVAKKTRRKKKV